MAEGASWVSRLRESAGTVRVRTTAVATAVVGLALLIGGIALVVAMRETLTDEVRSAARVRATDTAAALEAGTDPSFVAVDEADDDDDLFIQIIDDEGEVVASSPLVAGEAAVAELEPDASARVSIPAEDDDFLAVAAEADTDDGRFSVIAARTLDAVNESTEVVADLLTLGLPLLLVV
ncbi:MAG TPA: hypothetical protein VE466_08225, partial [Acidimicrobiales bacterium]|nr:hypothetical protein [Acidimicrobiales bacterium]